MFKQVILVVTFFPLGFLNGILDFKEYFVVRNAHYSTNTIDHHEHSTADLHNEPGSHKADLLHITCVTTNLMALISLMIKQLMINAVFT